MSEAGFYKLTDAGDDVLHAPNRVTAPKFTLTADTREKVRLPVDGWGWYDSRAAALAALGLPAEDAALESDLRAAGIDDAETIAKVREALDVRTVREEAVDDGIPIRVLDSTR